MPRNVKILLIEDEEIAQIVARKILEDFGCMVDVATTGAEALRLFEQNSYDLILMDLYIFDMDGFNIAKSFRRMKKRFKKTPIVALTAHTADGIRNRAKKLGFKDFINKPLTKESCETALNYVVFEEISSVPS